MPRTPEQIDADQNARAEAALAQVPANIAALIARSRLRLTLSLALHALFTARRREDVTRAAGYFNGLVFALNMADDRGAGWTADEWNALEDFCQLAESTALARLEE